MSPALSGRSSLRHRRPVTHTAARPGGHRPSAAGPHCGYPCRDRAHAYQLVSPALSGRSSLRPDLAGELPHQADGVTGPQRPVLIAARCARCWTTPRWRVTGPQRPVLIAAPGPPVVPRPLSCVTGPQRPVLIAAVCRVCWSLPSRRCHRPSAAGPHCGAFRAASLFRRHECHRPSAAGPHCGPGVAPIVMIPCSCVTGPQRPVLIAARWRRRTTTSSPRVTGPQRPVLIAAQAAAGLAARQGMCHRPSAAGPHCGTASVAPMPMASGVTGPQRPVLIAACYQPSFRCGQIQCHRPSAAGPHCGICEGELDTITVAQVSPALSGRSSLRLRVPGCDQCAPAGCVTGPQRPVLIAA